jgi:protein-disulfide isomerase
MIHFTRTVVAIFAALLLTGAAGAAQPDTGEQQRIEQAVRDYANRAAAEQAKNQDVLIARNSEALLKDPLTPVIGNPAAAVTIVEFFDYTCPYCKAVEPRLEKLLKDDPGVKLVVKDFPILTPQSVVAAKAALASVKQGKYARYHQAMMMFRGQLTEEAIFEIAKDSGLDVNRLRKDMDAPEIAGKIIADFNLARAIRVFQTPAFIVNNHLLTTPSAEIDFPKLVAAARANNQSGYRAP